MWRDTGRHHATVEAGTGVVLPQPRNIWGPRRLDEARKDPPLEASEEAQPRQHLDSRLLTSTSVRQYISVVLSHPACGSLWYCTPRELIQTPSDGPQVPQLFKLQVQRQAEPSPLLPRASPVLVTASL